MLFAAVLGTLPAKFPGASGGEPRRRGMPRDEILFAVNIRNPEAVDNVAGLQLQLHRLSDGYVNLVCSGHDLARLRVLIFHFPPPLVSRDFDRKRVWVRRGINCVAGEKVADQERKQDQHRDDYQRRDHFRRAVFARLRRFRQDRRLRIARRAANVSQDRDEQENRDERENHERHPKERPPQMRDVRRFGRGRIQC